MLRTYKVMIRSYFFLALSSGYIIKCLGFLRVLRVSADLGKKSVVINE
jgi:hypothetical protein